MSQHGLHLFGAKRVDIESIRRDMETAGRVRATIACAERPADVPDSRMQLSA